MSVYSNNGVDPVRFIVDAVKEARSSAAKSKASATAAAAQVEEASGKVAEAAEKVQEAAAYAAAAEESADAATAHAEEAKEAASVHPPEIMKVGKKLLDRHTYLETCNGNLDLSRVIIETYATCEIWIDYTSGSIVWPNGWYWLDGTSDPSSMGDHDIPPDIDKPYTRYRIVARNEGDCVYARIGYKSLFIK